MIYVADDADPASGRGPDGEIGAGNAGDGVEMCAKFFVGVVVAAFVHQMKIEVGEQVGKGVRVKDFERFAVVGASLNFVAAGLRGGGLIGGPAGFEEAFRAEFYGVGDLCGRDGGIIENNAGFRRPGKEETNGPSLGDGVRAEDAERVSVLRGEQGVDASVEVRRGFGLRGGSSGGQIWVLFWHGGVL